MHGNGAQSAPAATTMRLAQLGVGVLAFHLFNSILQEAVFHLPGFHHSIALSFLQTLCISGFALIEFVRANEVRKVPLKTYVMLSLFSTVNIFRTLVIITALLELNSATTFNKKYVPQKLHNENIVTYTRNSG